MKTVKDSLSSGFEIEENLASGFEKLEKIDVLDSVLADCESGGAFIMAEKTKRRPIAKYLVGIAAALAIVACAALAIGISNRGLTAKPISSDGDINATICLDVNPSVEIAVDKSETVVDVTADNEDGESIINGRDFKGDSLSDTVTTLVNRMVDEDYISNLKNSVLVSVESQNGEFGKQLEKKMSDSIYELLGSKNIEGAVLSQTITQADDELVRLAKMYKISVGKALMIKDIIEAAPYYTFEDLASRSVNDLCLTRQTVGMENGRISINGKSKSHYITVEKAVEAALEGNARQDVTDVNVMLEDWQGGEAAVRYHVTYTAADGELKSYYINPVNGEIISRDGGAIAGAGGYPTVPAEEAKQLAVNYICSLDGVSEDDIAVADCVITYDENGYPRQYVTMNSLKDAKIAYYAYVYDETVPSGISGNIYGEKQNFSGISENEALNILLEKTGRDYADLTSTYEKHFGSVVYYRFYFISDDWKLDWYVNKQTGEVIGGHEVMLTKYGGDGTPEEIKQYALDAFSVDPDNLFDFDLSQLEVISFEKKILGEHIVYFLTIRDNTPGKELNTVFSQVDVVDEEEPDLFRTDDELLEAASKDLEIDKSEFENVEIEDEKSMDYTHVRFTAGDTDYWYAMERSYSVGENFIAGKTKKPHGEKDYPIISEETAIKNALAHVCAQSVDDVESCEVSYDDEKKQYTVSVIVYSSKVHMNVFWEFYVDGYTGIGRGGSYDDKGDYGPVTIEFLTEQEAADIVLSYIEERGYPKSEMTVTVEAEEVEDDGVPIIRYHIKAVHSVTEFESEIYADSKNPSVINPHINHRLVKASKTGKYISEEIAKEIAVCGQKDFYTVVSCTLDESGELPVYKVVTYDLTGANMATKVISAESGMVLEIK